MIGKTITEIQIGDKATFTKTMTETDVYLFAGISGDLNPAHVNQVAAEKNMFKGRICHGMLVSSLISTVLAMYLPGSASGRMSIALGVLGKQYLEMAIEQGINPQVLHRIAALACGGLDSLPHNGAVITLLSICGLTHKESYAYIGMVSVIVPLCTTILIIMLAVIGVV